MEIHSEKCICSVLLFYVNIIENIELDGVYHSMEFLDTIKKCSELEIFEAMPA